MKFIISFFFSFSPLEFLFLSPKGQFTAEEPNFLWVIETFPGPWRKVLHINKMLWLLTCPFGVSRSIGLSQKVKQATKSPALSILFLSHAQFIGCCLRARIMVAVCMLAEYKQCWPVKNKSKNELSGGYRFFRILNQTLSSSCIFVFSYVPFWNILIHV